MFHSCCSWSQSAAYRMCPTCPLSHSYERERSSLRYHTCLHVSLTPNTATAQLFCALSLSIFLAYHHALIQFCCTCYAACCSMWPWRRGTALLACTSTPRMRTAAPSCTSMLRTGECSGVFWGHSGGLSLRRSIRRLGTQSMMSGSVWKKKSCSLCFFG